MGYATDLTNQQWWSIKRFFEVGNYGNRRKHSVRELVNAVLYLLKTGCQWRMLPKDFPPYSTVHTFYRRCRIKGIWEKIKNYLVKKKKRSWPQSSAKLRNTRFTKRQNSKKSRRSGL